LATAWCAASIAASAVLFIVSLAFPSTPFWPFLFLNWAVFAPGFLLVTRRTEVPQRLSRLALIVFAAVGFFALYHSDKII
jgi:hypothetical protein